MRLETGAQAKGVYEGQWFRKLKRVDVPRGEAWKAASGNEARKGSIVMQKINGKSRFGAIWHFDDEERGDSYFSLAHQGESCASVDRRYEVLPSVIRRVFNQMINKSVNFLPNAEGVQTQRRTI
jgi:hypothetical protein